MLDDEQVERYARQIVIAGIGAAGQQKLLASTVLVAGDPRGCNQAALYLRAAGVTVVGSLPPDARGDVSLVLVADAAAIDETLRSALLRLGRPICWYEIEEHGFRSGLHPSAALPSSPRSRRPDECASIHDAAACDAAAVACAVLCGLVVEPGAVRFER